MLIHVWKYEACGNDFIFMPLKYCSKDRIKRICDRHYGIGADGVIVSDVGEFVYFNNDGTRAKLCGNGLRCFALHQFNKDKKMLGYIKVGEDTYEYQIENAEPFIVEVKMKIPTYVDNQKDVMVVDSGVKHIVILSEKYVDDEEVKQIGEYYNSLEVYKDGINVNVVECGEEYICHTYERGCGLTLACGSGALACFKILNDLGKVEDVGEIYFRNGESLLFKKFDGYISMIGRAKLLMEGDFIYE